MENNVTKSSGRNWVLAAAYTGLAVALATGGIHVGETDDAPGAALLGLLLAIGLIVLAVKTARRKV